MKISTILDRIDSKRMALPEFQRPYVWTGAQVRQLFSSLYHRYPVGCLLIWETANEKVPHRGDVPANISPVELLLDGQQRITSLYGVMRGKPPPFFNGNAKAFTGLHFHMGEEIFSFYQVSKMKSDPLWVSVSDLIRVGNDGMLEFVEKAGGGANEKLRYMNRLSSLLGIAEIDMTVDNTIKSDKPLDVVVDIFNRVNSGGTKLSKGDLALAKICANNPAIRRQMNDELQKWRDVGYNFTTDWLLRSVNTALTGRAEFSFLHGKSTEEVQSGLVTAIDKIGRCLEMISGQLGLDHSKVFFAHFAVPVMVYYFVKQGKNTISAEEQDKLLFWFLQAGMWGRYSGSTETVINQDIAAINANGIDGLLAESKREHKLRKVSADDFTAQSMGARFYRVLYFLTRVGESRDWGTGSLLKASMLGKNSQLEMHHIFPKAQLKKAGHQKEHINALANFCFLTKGTNLKIGSRLPDEYFPEIEGGALSSQWIPQDRELWRIDNYDEFLKARRKLLADEMNTRLAGLLHGDNRWLEPAMDVKHLVPGGVSDDDERAVLDDVNDWVVQNGLTAGDIAYEHSNAEGEPQAILDLAWPNGVQEGRGQRIALLLDEEQKTIAIANRAGFWCFDSVEELKKHIQKEHLDE